MYNNSTTWSTRHVVDKEDIMIKLKIFIIVFNKDMNRIMFFCGR
jgi:hypothetical protein